MTLLTIPNFFCLATLGLFVILGISYLLLLLYHYSINTLTLNLSVYNHALLFRHACIHSFCFLPPHCNVILVLSSHFVSLKLPCRAL